MNPAQSSQGHSSIWNFFTCLTLVALALVATFFVLIFLNPFSAFNPFPPYDLPALMSLPTATATYRALPEIWTATPAPPTNTPQPSPTAALMLVTVTAEDSLDQPLPTEVTPPSGYAFALKADPVALDAKIFHPDSECNWVGVAGQAEDLQGRPAKGIRVAVIGRLNGENVEIYSLTGTALQYGPAGYEFQLGQIPVASEDRLYIQLLDQAGLPLSGKIVFDTFDACDKNLVLINFEQVR